MFSGGQDLKMAPKILSPRGKAHATPFLEGSRASEYDGVSLLDYGKKDFPDAVRIPSQFT